MPKFPKGVGSSSHFSKGTNFMVHSGILFSPIYVDIFLFDARKWRTLIWFWAVDWFYYFRYFFFPWRSFVVMLFLLLWLSYLSFFSLLYSISLGDRLEIFASIVALFMLQNQGMFTVLLQCECQKLAVTLSQIALYCVCSS